MLTLTVLALVTVERLGEVFVAKRNAQRLLLQGAVESGAAHFPWITGILTVWLLGLWILAWQTPLDLGWLTVFFLAMGLKLWTIATLGPQWTARIIRLPHERLVTSGPYRYVRHPNYLFLMGEIATLPLAFGLPSYALIFSALVGVILWIRIRAENVALAPYG
jgi:methyltransferase